MRTAQFPWAACVEPGRGVCIEDDRTSRTALKATSGLLSGFSGSLLLGIGLFALFFGRCTDNVGSWLQVERNGREIGIIFGPFIRIAGIGIMGVGVLGVLAGIGFIAAALGFGFSIFKGKRPPSEP